MRFGCESTVCEVEPVESNALFAHWHGRLRYVIGRLQHWTIAPLPVDPKNQAEVVRLIERLESAVNELGQFISVYAAPALETESFEASEIESRFDNVDITIDRLDSYLFDSAFRGSISL
ncbi:MAG TPA: hypothetical protein VHD56_12940 [Tepidisphaeraceae bacterium]|nr:hypothetical protein [Tepidisphaeraceae bacterium]